MDFDKKLAWSKRIRAIEVSAKNIEFASFDVYFEDVQSAAGIRLLNEIVQGYLKERKLTILRSEAELGSEAHLISPRFGNIR